MKISPMVKIIVGFLIFMGGLQYRTGVQLFDYIILAIAIVGFAIGSSGARDLRRQSNPEYKE
ncbi:hypothetical protein [Desulfobacula phenolica]|uniref:Uncharacterized protein n=1 Tax=Desulfobacula phenolica TaxID=90732 RepID=A0A1H2KD43_9BACT|nr:hypothetical protein [Desulfobacula phenolica]SDU66522.1 hypothetical protein SAMN04487931_1329 [Desulfobacula phenolica]